MGGQLIARCIGSSRTICYENTTFGMITVCRYNIDPQASIPSKFWESKLLYSGRTQLLYLYHCHFDCWRHLSCWDTHSDTLILNSVVPMGYLVFHFTSNPVLSLFGIQLLSCQQIVREQGNVVCKVKVEKFFCSSPPWYISNQVKMQITTCCKIYGWMQLGYLNIRISTELNWACWEPIRWCQELLQ